MLNNNGRLYCYQLCDLGHVAYCSSPCILLYNVQDEETKYTGLL